MFQQNNPNENVLAKHTLGLLGKPTSYKKVFENGSMFQQNHPNENVLAKHTLGSKSSSKVLEAKHPHTISIALRNRIKSEIEATSNSPISCLDRSDFGYYSMVYLV